MRCHCHALPVLLIASLVLFAAGCAEPREPGRYYNDEHDFSIRFPADWELREGLMGSAVAALSPGASTDTFRQNVNVVVEKVPASLGLDEYMEAQQQALGRLATPGSLTPAAPVQLEGGTEARRHAYRMVFGQNRLEGVQYFVVSGRRGYSITCTMLEGTTDETRERIEQIARTFRVE